MRMMSSSHISLNRISSCIYIIPSYILNTLSNKNKNSDICMNMVGVCPLLSVEGVANIVYIAVDTQCGGCGLHHCTTWSLAFQ